MRCQVIETTHTLGKKWSIPVIEEIALNKFSGFNKFIAKTGVTPRVLSAYLKELETAGLIRKKLSVHKNGMATAYALTEKGAEFHNLIRKLKRWNIKWDHVPDFCLHTPCSECDIRK